MMADREVSVLVVAPETGLEFVRREVEAIINTSLDVSVVPSPVTHDAFSRALREARYDVWCILTHGVRSNATPWESGVLMEGDTILSTQVLATYAKVYKPGLIFLNTCSSDEMARLVMQTSGSDVICTVIDVPDEQAFITGRLLMERIAEHGDYRKAYEESRPADMRTYLYLTGYDEKGEGKRRTRQRVSSAVPADDIAALVESLVRVIQGDEFGSTGIVNDIRAISEQTRRYTEEDRIWKLKAEQRMEATAARALKNESEIAQVKSRHSISTPVAASLGVLLAALVLVELLQLAITFR